MTKVLVIDDIASVRRSVEVVLRREGWSVTAVGALSEAEPLLDRDGFDLVSTDILMPEADGLAVIDAVRKRSPRTRILAMSGGGSLVPTEEALSLAKRAADAALPKPFDRAELLDAVRPLLAGPS